MTDEMMVRAIEKTHKHIDRVQELLADLIQKLARRGAEHDQSKFDPVEIDNLAKLEAHIAEKGQPAYGTPEYAEFTTILGPMVQHHYERNTHHPEHDEVTDEWRDVPGLDGLYAVSASGRIRDRDGVIETGHITPLGYRRVWISVPGQLAYTALVHDLVARAFLPADSEAERMSTAIHRNGITSDNRASNLERGDRIPLLMGSLEEGMRDQTGMLVHCAEFNLATTGFDQMELLLRANHGRQTNSNEIWFAAMTDGNHAGLHFSARRLDDDISRPGIMGMDLLDLVEMICDWKAASERGEEPAMSLSMATGKYRFDDQLRAVFFNTAERAGWPHK